METFVWLVYPATGGKAQFPVNAADTWRARGWQDCEPPADTEAYLRDAPPAELTPEPAPEPKPKPAGRKRGGEPTTAPEE